jgi:hypothetical protein
LEPKVPNPYAADRDLAQCDREIERRQHHDDFVKAHPELLTADVRAMDKALNEAERKALTVDHVALPAEPNLHPLFATMLEAHMAVPRVVAKLEAQHLKTEARRYKDVPVAMTGHGELA